MSTLSIPPEPNGSPADFTELQGQYLAFIHSYIKLHQRAPAEQDMERYFGVTPPIIDVGVLERQMYPANHSQKEQERLRYTKQSKRHQHDERREKMSPG